MPGDVDWHRGRTRDGSILSACWFLPIFRLRRPRLVERALFGTLFPAALAGLYAFKQIGPGTAQARSPQTVVDLRLGVRGVKPREQSALGRVGSRAA